MAKKSDLYWNASVIEDLLHIKVYHQMKVWELHLHIDKFDDSILTDYFSTVPGLEEMKSEILRDINQAIRISKKDKQIKFFNDVFYDALFICVTVITIMAIMLVSYFTNC
jgi:hypothetical protein